MYSEEDAAYDAYVAERGEPASTLDIEHEEFSRPMLTVLMHRDSERVELRIFPPVRRIVMTYPPIGAAGIGVPGVVREIPYGPREDGSGRMLALIAQFEAAGWSRWAR